MTSGSLADRFPGLFRSSSWSQREMFHCWFWNLWIALFLHFVLLKCVDTGSEAKNTFCACKGPGFNSQQSHTLPGDPIQSSDLCSTRLTHDVHTHIYIYSYK